MSACASLKGSMVDALTFITLLLTNSGHVTDHSFFIVLSSVLQPDKHAAAHSQTQKT